MKVLMVNTYDVRGGAARSVLRMYHGLTDEGVDVNMLVQNKWGDDPGIIGPKTFAARILARLRPYADFAITFPWHRRRIPYFPAYLPDNLVDSVKEIRPDIVHLNWIAGGFIRLETLARLDVPVVWTLHDMWAFTGGCHYSRDCDRYRQACGKCPVLHSRSEKDPSRWIFIRKKRTYAAIRSLRILTPSRWLADRAAESSLLSAFPIEVFPNSLDTRVFFPEPKAEARKVMGLAKKKKIVLFGALDATRNPLKGFRELAAAMELIQDKEGIELAVFGSSDKGTSTLFGFPARYFGHIDDDDLLRRLYSAADVMVVPSLQEVFGQTATEAMACGTPVTAFGATGLLDIVEHMKNGYLARPFDPADLAAGIRWCMEDPARRRQLSEKAVQTVSEKFDISINTPHLISIYRKSIDHFNENQSG